MIAQDGSPGKAREERHRVPEGRHDPPNPNVERAPPLAGFVFLFSCVRLCRGRTHREGHGFSRAANPPTRTRASAPEARCPPPHTPPLVIPKRERSERGGTCFSAGDRYGS